MEIYPSFARERRGGETRHKRLEIANIHADYVIHVWFTRICEIKKWTQDNKKKWKKSSTQYSANAEMFTYLQKLVDERAILTLVVCVFYYYYYYY